MQWLKQSTAFTTIVGPVLDSTGVEYTSAVIGDLSITKNGTTAAMAAAATLTHIANGYYTLVGTTGNSDTLGRLDITCNRSTYQMPPVRFEVLHANVYDVLLGSTALSTLTAAGVGALTGDGVALTKVMEMLVAFMSGKVSVSSAAGVSTYSWKKQDGTTQSFTALCSETNGTRATTGALS